MSFRVVSASAHSHPDNRPSRFLGCCGCDMEQSQPSDSASQMLLMAPSQDTEVPKMRGEEKDRKSIKQFLEFMIFHTFISLLGISPACSGLEMCGFSQSMIRSTTKTSSNTSISISNNSNSSNSLCFRNPSWR